MNTDRLEALLWARVDGTIDPEELAELEAHLAEHPEPRQIERQITMIAEGLDSLEKVHPPAELRERIDAALAHATPPTVRTDHPVTTPHPHPAAVSPLRWLPLAASLLIGVAIGYLLQPGTGGSIDQSEVAGTMLTPPAETSVAPVEIDFDTGTVAASRVGADVVIDVMLSAEIELAVTVAGAGGPVSFGSLSTSERLAAAVTTEHGWVVMRMNGPGNATISVIAFEADDPLRLQISSHGSLVEERWIGASRNEVAP